MNRRMSLDHYLTYPLLRLLLILSISQAPSSYFCASSSTPNNLINFYTHSPNDDSNSTSLNQFQNEYQNRHNSAKSTSSERHKPSVVYPSNIPTSPPTSKASDVLYDHLTGDLSNLGSIDYQDHRAATNVPDCKGRLKLNGTRGFITDGPGHYQTNLQCIWLIDSGKDNATVRIQINQFNTECNYDYLYIFDGDSIYSPLVAALSGDMRDFISEIETSPAIFGDSQTNSSVSSINVNSTYSSYSLSAANTVLSLPSTDSRPFEIKTNSGKAFIYFHSDTAQSMPGFYITYSIDSCPLECSNRGDCDYTNLTCKCNPGFFGDGCQFVLCPNNCTSPDHGVCDIVKSCICKSGFKGPDCSLKHDSQSWISLRSDIHSNSIPARAFHQACVVDDIMWIIGGKSQALSNTNLGVNRKTRTQTVHSFNLSKRSWSDVNIDGVTGIDHLAELSGHSVAAKGSKIFVFGGMAMNTTILKSLTVLDTKTNTLTTLSSGREVKVHDEDLVAPIAVTGHSANIIDSHMYVFLGYNPLYGYLNFVQKFNLANNSWSLVERKGSHVEGSIGHTSTYDTDSRLVYIYGGHNSIKLSSLYSFNPYNEVWTLLQPGPSPKYYHNSVIINKQLIIFGGNSYNISHQSDQCFQQTYLIYDLSCAKPSDSTSPSNSTTKTLNCPHKCWDSMDDFEAGILKRHGHSVVKYGKELILYGGFNGVILNDIRIMNIRSCDTFGQESDCALTKLALSCYWNPIDSNCEDQTQNFLNTSSVLSSMTHANCTRTEIDFLQHTCKGRETCTDCLSTTFGCVWCGLLDQCQYHKCKSSSSKEIIDVDICNKDEYAKAIKDMTFDSHSVKSIQMNQDLNNEIECKRFKTCYLCHSKTYCSWQNEECMYNSPANAVSSPTSGLSAAPQEDFIDMYGNNQNYISKTPMFTNSTRFAQRYDPLNRSFLAALTNGLISPSPFQSCDSPCYMRGSCNSCTQTKCIWCSTTEQCVDSSAYFAYYAMGQCMHYVAHIANCPVSSCADIETCDRCLTNPKCGWLNDISNTGKGKCVEGTGAGPSFVAGNNHVMASGLIESNSQSGATNLMAEQSWYYTSCPACQCNGHSYCKPNTSICYQPCQDNTEGLHCERCIPGYFGDPINGGSCRPCRCNGHAQSCMRETGKCLCSTKGIIGHTCNKCDEQNHYIGDPLGPGNGTCYYNLTTDYQYTFNMSKPEDHFYSDINFINVPLRKDSDVDFTIACSRLALVNITSGTSYKNRKPIHTGLECNSFRLRLPHDNFMSTDANYSFFIHVYKFQTPFILQIAFSQHRTLLYPTQFFFTFSR